ncbi:hypothetical protein ACVTNF_003431 [Photobacterium damselae]
MNLINNRFAIKEIIISLIVVSGNILIGLGSAWLYWKYYIKQIFHPSISLVGDPLYFMSLLFGFSLSIGFCAIIASVFIIHKWIKKKRIRLKPYDGERKNTSLMKLWLIVATTGSLLSFTSNIILLQKIVPEYGYVLCPKKIGYKKNLLRDYVLDLNQCERF